MNKGKNYKPNVHYIKQILIKNCETREAINKYEDASKCLEKLAMEKTKLKFDPTTSFIPYFTNMSPSITI